MHYRLVLQQSRYQQQSALWRLWRLLPLLLVANQLWMRLMLLHAHLQSWE